MGLDEKILGATIRLLADSGYRGATTKKIAALAGISESTIFRLHGDKSSLVHKAFHTLLPDGNTMDLSTLLGNGDVAAGLAGLLQRCLAVIVRYMPALKLSMQMPDAEEFRTDPDAALKPYVDQLCHYLHNLHAQNLIVQADFKALAQLLFATLLAQAPSLTSGDADEAMNQLAWKHALFLEKKLKNHRNGSDAVNFTRLRENKPSDIRGNNLRVVLKMFLEAEKLSAPDLQKHIHLSKTTLTKLIAQLLDDGLLSALGVDSNFDERGRPPSYYRINGDFGYCVVVQFFNDKVTTAVTNLKNEIIHLHDTAITDQLTLERSLDIIVDTFHLVLQQVGVGPEHALGLCVAAGGPTNKDDGSVAYTPRYHNWPKQAPLKKELRERLPLNLNIIVNNEMNCQALGEQYFGKAYGKRSALVFEAGDKLGSGIIMDNRLFQGAHSIAGEIGHMKLDAHSKVECVCGAHGCFRALVHSDRIVSMVSEMLPQYPGSLLRGRSEVAVTDVFDALASHDPLAVCIMEEMAQWMGMALSNLFLTFDPEIIVLQGVYTQAGPVFLDMVRRYMIQDKFPYLGELDLTIEYSALGDRAGILGGSKLITEQLLSQYCKQD